ncbi:Carbon storage regulator [Anatilimnocola aggregata]|uniref:Translational regulator CsrA n=1 Tax=Anatilimnocola aggregata TaxID=2528021 RepID=A0A517YI33_9BACT|nr:carbon storage regulator CsrA [Anatilimnocola aggregata]QDU29897.1 Carbon storage regulator [Anatilimnocola aggregata]
MLVLSRKRDERILIGDSIVVTIVDIRGDKVRIGIEAPSDVAVHREEVLLALQQHAAQAAAAQNSSPAKPNNP